MKPINNPNDVLFSGAVHNTSTESDVSCHGDAAAFEKISAGLQHDANNNGLLSSRESHPVDYSIYSSPSSSVVTPSQEFASSGITNANSTVPSVRPPASKQYALNEPFSLRKPTEDELEHLRLYCPEIFKDEITRKAKSISEIELLNLNDYLAHWGVLDRSTRHLLAEFVNSDWSRTDWQDKGLKTKEGNVTLAQALLLLIGLGIENVMPNSGDRLILSNLRTKAGKFRKGGQKQRSKDPKAAIMAYQKFMATFAPADLFPANKAYVVLFESPDELKAVGLNCHLDDRRVAIGQFFNAVRDFLRICKERGCITAYLAGHEISSSSITPLQVNPHSHAVIWLPHYHDTAFLDAAREAGIPLKYKPTPIVDYSTLERFIPYIMQAHSLVMRYNVERPEGNLREFNLAAREALYATHQLYHGHGTSYDVVDIEDDHNDQKGSGTKNTIGRCKLIKSGIPKRAKQSNNGASPSTVVSGSSTSRFTKKSKIKGKASPSK